VKTKIVAGRSRGGKRLTEITSALRTARYCPGGGVVAGGAGDAGCAGDIGKLIGTLIGAAVFVDDGFENSCKIE
jgi:hypothetical protein